MKQPTSSPRILRQIAEACLPLRTKRGNFSFSSSSFDRSPSPSEYALLPPPSTECYLTAPTARTDPPSDRPRIHSLRHTLPPSSLSLVWPLFPLPPPPAPAASIIMRAICWPEPPRRPQGRAATRQRQQQSCFLFGALRFKTGQNMFSPL